jgi:hypothetical protein
MKTLLNTWGHTNNNTTGTDFLIALVVFTMIIVFFIGLIYCLGLIAKLFHWLIKQVFKDEEE